PRLPPDRGTVVVGRIDQLVGARKAYRIKSRALELAAPPVLVAVVELDALNQDQPARVCGEDRVPGSFGRQAPVGSGAAVSPVRCAMRLVGEIGGAHCTISH